MRNLQTVLADFEAVLDKVISQTWATSASPDYLEALAKGSQLLVTDIIQAGDFCEEQLQSEKADSFPFLLFHFGWTDKTKSFLILWRDVLFQAQKAQILNLEGKVKQADLDKLKAQSKTIILEAADEWKAYFKKESERINRIKKGREKQISAWSLQQNPYPVYRKQLEELPKQCNELVAQFQDLSQTVEVFVQIKNHIQNTLNNCQQEIDETKNIAQKTLARLGDTEKISKIPSWLEDLENELTPVVHIDRFSNQLNEISEDLKPKMKVPVDTHGGLIQFKEINFEKSIQLWLESEILPILYEVWELTENGNNALKMALLNIRNRAVLLSNEVKESKAPNLEKENLGQPLNVFLEKTTQRESNLNDLSLLINKRLSKSFGVFSVYHPNQDFLPLPLQSTINQFKTTQNKWLEGLQIWWKKQWTAFQNFTTSVKIEESLSTSEKIVRLVQSRQTNAENSHYSSIFLTKGYIGESFWVGRKNELAHIEKLIQQWKEGFRGAVILSGQRLSGKSLFGELVAHRHFPKDTIRLSPNTLIKFQGRQFQCKTDLGECLDFIKKYTLQKKVLIWIDDLELWSTSEIPLSQNVRKLCRHIDNHSRQIFFMVSMSTWLKYHLNLIHDLDKKFQAEINLDQMTVAEIREAILIRHGATHKVLVNAEGNEITPPVFKKITSKIHKTVDGNIGEALNLWSYSTFKYEGDKVRFDFKTPYVLPDFINSDTAIVLTTLMMNKKSNEYHLRKLFGTPFKEKYGGIVQRMISVGLLTRHPDGSLEVNEAVANEVGKLLAQKQFLKLS